MSTLPYLLTKLLKYDTFAVFNSVLIQGSKDRLSTLGILYLMYYPLLSYTLCSKEQSPVSPTRDSGSSSAMVRRKISFSTRTNS